MDVVANKSTGETLRGLREERGMTQAELAQALGKPQSFVSKTESGERSLRAYELVRYAEGLGVAALTVFQRIELRVGGGRGLRVAGVAGESGPVGEGDAQTRRGCEGGDEAPSAPARKDGGAGDRLPEDGR